MLCPDELTGLLRDPGRCRLARAASQMDPPCIEFDKEQDLDRLEPQRLHRKEISGQQRGFVTGQKGAPVAIAASAFRRGLDAMTFEHVVDGGAAHPVAQPTNFLYPNRGFSRAS